jgi:hypothetical protein
MRRKTRRMRLRVHPEVMEDAAGMTPNAQKAAMAIIRAFDQAAEMTDADAGAEVFEDNLRKVLKVDAECGAFDELELDENERRSLEARLRNEPKIQ